jgi:hypothetical protein
MNEQLLALWKRLRRKVDQLVIIALVVLLGVTAFFWWVEQEVPAPTIPDRPPVFIPPFPEEGWQQFQNMFVHPKTLSKVPEFQGLLEFNMFDPRSVEVQTELVSRLDEQFKEAEKAYAANDLDEAERICRGIIKQMSSYAKAQQMLRMINARREALKESTTNP